MAAGGHMWRHAGAVGTLPEAIRQALNQNLQPLRKDEVIIQTGNERLPIASVRSPGSAKLLMNACKAVRTSARKRSMETDAPPALRILRTTMSNYVVAEPVARYDSAATDQYELKWNDKKTEAHMDLLPLLQPRNMEVPQGFVTEIPITLENVNNWSLVLHLGEASTREESEGPPRKQKVQTPAQLQTAASEEPKAE